MRKMVNFTVISNNQQLPTYSFHLYQITNHNSYLGPKWPQKTPFLVAFSEKSTYWPTPNINLNQLILPL